MNPSAAESSPVDVRCLTRIVAGEKQAAQALIDFYRHTTTEQLEKLEHAVHSQSAEEVETLAHSCAGSSSLLGMTAIVPPLRRLEQMGIERQWVQAGDVLAQAWTELEHMMSFLGTSKNGGSDV